MVEILCPHCEEEIELDDDASGEFACPYCEGEFEWNVDEDDSSGGKGTSVVFDLSNIKPIAVVQGVIVGISFIVLLMCFTADPLYTLSIEDEEWLYSADTMTVQADQTIYGMSGTEKYTSYIDHLTKLKEDNPEVFGTDERIDGIIEAMEGWDSAGNTYQFFTLMALISVILMPILSLTFNLYERNVIDMPVKAAVLIHFSGRGAYYFGCFMWFLAIVLHMILAPEASGPIGMGEFDVGMFGYAGAFWLGLVMSLLAPIVHAGLWFVPQDN